MNPYARRYTRDCLHFKLFINCVGILQQQQHYNLPTSGQKNNNSRGTDGRSVVRATRGPRPRRLRPRPDPVARYIRTERRARTEHITKIEIQTKFLKDQHQTHIIMSFDQLDITTQLYSYGVGVISFLQYS